MERYIPLLIFFGIIGTGCILMAIKMRKDFKIDKTMRERGS